MGAATTMGEASSTTKLAAVLLADISGSTPLYEAIGDVAAQRAIASELQRLRAAIQERGGVYIREKGDDVLAHFEDPSAALEAARIIVSAAGHPRLSIHAGLHFGPVVMAEGDIFGETVNVTARLAGLANAGETLLSRDVVQRLPAADASSLRRMDRIWLKGVSVPLDVYSLTSGDTAMRTAMPPPSTLGGAEATVLLTSGDRVRACREAERVTIGRSEECDVVLPHAWISRRHAVVSVRGGKATLEDRSSSGTYVAVSDNPEILLRREAIMLTGDGVISPAMPSAQAEAAPIHFEVVQR